MPTDHHVALGVPPDAGLDEIRAAYLRVMRDHHPDRRPGDLASAEIARRANVAYRALRQASAPGGGHVAGTPRAAAPRARAEDLRLAAHANRAYSTAQREYREAFSRACLRVGVAVLLVGAVLLFTLP